MIFGSKLLFDINKSGCKPSKKFFSTCRNQISSGKMGYMHDLFSNLAIDKLFDLLCRYLHYSFSTKT